MRISIENVTKLLNANRIGTKESEIDWILTDVRCVLLKKPCFSL